MWLLKKIHISKTCSCFKKKIKNVNKISCNSKIMLCIIFKKMYMTLKKVFAHFKNIFVMLKRCYTNVKKMCSFNKKCFLSFKRIIQRVYVIYYLKHTRFFWNICIEKNVKRVWKMFEKYSKNVQGVWKKADAKPYFFCGVWNHIFLRGMKPYIWNIRIVYLKNVKHV